MKTDVEIFDIRRNQCIEMPPLPSPVSFMATVCRDETTLLIGGIGDKGKYSDEIIEYDPKTGHNKALLLVEKERVGSLAVLHDNKLVVISGVVCDAKAVECFNFLSNF